ncbi:hypothetical protein CQA40_03330 [Helicobacter sp. MIT 01-3238]|nr:hypothetical protein CQA40_03330 [Helicobacter sp. MIT 01-3238]
MQHKITPLKHINLQATIHNQGFLKCQNLKYKKCQKGFHILNLSNDLSHLFKIYVKINSKKIKIFC